MARFHNAPSDFANLASGETGIGYRSPQKRKEFFFQNWSDNHAKKNRLQDLYFLFACGKGKIPKTGIADASKIYFRTRRMRYAT